VDDPSEYEMLDVVFLNINNMPVPYFIKSIKILNNKAILSFEDIDSTEKAEFLLKKEMYLPLSTLPKLTGNKFYYHEVEGFHVKDINFGDLGVLHSILDYPHQAVMQIFHHDKEILIPVNDEIILDVNRKTKTLTIRAPEGLIEIYLNS
jgi:16S rRNA processing protein RimM